MVVFCGNEVDGFSLLYFLPEPADIGTLGPEVLLLQVTTALKKVKKESKEGSGVTITKREGLVTKYIRVTKVTKHD